MLTRPTVDLAIAGAVLVGAIGLGVCVGYLMWGRQHIVVEETRALPIQHPDGSLTPIRDPKGKPASRAPTRPKGELTRIGEVTVLPEPVRLPVRHVDGKECPAEVVQCAPVVVRWDTTEEEDGSHRVSVAAQGADILDGVDIPLRPSLKLRPLPLAIGPERLADGRLGVAVERDIGRLRVGGTASLLDGEPEANIRILWRFQ